MKNNLLRAMRFVSSALLMTVFAVLSFADGQGLAGKWKMASVTPDGGTVDWTLTMKQDGDTWIATVSANDADAPGKEVKVVGDSLHLKTPYGSDYYDVDVKLDGDKLTGKWSGNGDSGATTGTRVADSTAK